MIRKRSIALLCYFTTMLLAGCVPFKTNTPTPTSIADVLADQNWTMEGLVLEVRTSDRVMVFFGEIEDKPNVITSLGEVSFAGDCLVWKAEGGTVRPASISELTIGQKIKFKTETILESFPFKTQAYEVLILSLGAVESQTPISTFITPQFIGTITGLEDYEKGSATKLVHLENIDFPQRPEVEEADLVLTSYSLIWRQTKSGYELCKEDGLAVGQVVSILSPRFYGVDELNPYPEPIEEIIILP